MNRDLRALVVALRQSGIAYPCAMCEKMWRAHARGDEFCEAQRGTVRTCYGPPSGGMFPLYEGPLTKEHLAQHCFACGAQTEISIGGKRNADKGYLGVCKKHLPLVERIVPKDVMADTREKAETGFKVDEYRDIIDKN